MHRRIRIPEVRPTTRAAAHPVVRFPVPEPRSGTNARPGKPLSAVVRVRAGRDAARGVGVRVFRGLRSVARARRQAPPGPPPPRPPRRREAAPRLVVLVLGKPLRARPVPRARLRCHRRPPRLSARPRRLHAQAPRPGAPHHRSGRRALLLLLRTRAPLRLALRLLPPPRSHRFLRPKAAAAPRHRRGPSPEQRDDGVRPRGLRDDDHWS
mmetsp:Transcript_6496/g.20281  ORF Transcript_6496/g.20281 Transcript_6496/m.20281 type:complete len:210 (-) Transcript_6496:342-971(-)